MSRSRRPRRSQVGGLAEIWPGFVDALAALLVVVIFVLLVFMVSQFYLSNILSGRDQLVGELSEQINELADLLDLAREEGEELRENNARMNAELRDVIGERDTLQVDIEQQVSEVARLTDQLGEADQRIEQLERDRDDLDASLADAYQTIEADKETLKLRLTELASLQADLEALRAAREQLEIDVATAGLARQVLEEDVARLERSLSQAQVEEESLRASLETSQQTIEADAEELRRRAAALAELRSNLEQSQDQLTERERALQAAQALVLETETQLADREQALQAAQTLAQEAESQLAESQEALGESRSQLTEQQESLIIAQAALAAANRQLAEREQTVEQLLGDLSVSQSFLSARDTTIDELENSSDTLLADLLLSREEKEQLLADLGSVRDRSQALETELAEEQERTVLAQREIDARDIRIEELMIALNQTEAALDDEIELTTESKALVAQLNQQVELLNDRLNEVQAALEESEASVSERDIEIADLNSRLNQALIRRVEELARYRSEFFGRLRQVLGQRSDVRVVGDRFVFQSEVLFDTGSATLAPEGRRQLADLATTLLALIADLPEDIDWILRVDGHTDVRPIFSDQFRSNWDLSAARAIEVVEFLITQGLEADRLAAAGFGEYQPLDAAETEEAYRRNRRIELKFDQK